MTLLFILPSQHLPNQRFSRKILTTLNAGVINWTWNLTPLKQGPKTQFLHSIPFKIAYWNLYLQQNILESTSLQTFHGIRTQIAFLKRQTTQLAFLEETSRFTPNLLNLLSTKFLFVLSQSTVPQWVWCPFTYSNISNLEAVQRRAAIWVKHDYGQTSSVTEMMQSLHWRRLDQRRIDNKLSLT